MLKKFSFALSLAVAVLCSIGLSCKNPVVPPATPGHTGITLQATNISYLRCTLQWSNDSAAASHRYLLIRDNRDTLYNDSMLAGVPTKILQDTTLTPSSNYAYWIYRIVNGQRWDSANLNVHTLDTTSSNFRWETQVVGSAGSELRDVCVVSDTSIWVVGKINDDSDPQNVIDYTVMRWNGSVWQKWTRDETGVTEMTAIYAFSDTDVWAYGGTGMHFDGTSWTSLSAGPAFNHTAVLAMWGTDRTNLYFASQNGVFVHFDGSKFSAINTSTTLPFTDVFGITSNGTTSVYGIATNEPVGYGKQVYDIHGLVATPEADSGITRPVSGIWISPEGACYLSGVGNYQKDSITQQRWSVIPASKVGTLKYAVRGNAENDLAYSGDYGDIVHFNGVRWTSFLTETQFDGSYERISMRGNVIACAGWTTGSTGMFAVGKR